jgi:hypothetical protein
LPCGASWSYVDGDQDALKGAEMFFGLLPDEANHTEAFKELVYSMKDMETIIDVMIRPDASSYFFHRAARRRLQQITDPMPQAPPTLAVSSKPSFLFFFCRAIIKCSFITNNQTT